MPGDWHDMLVAKNRDDWRDRSEIGVHVAGHGVVDAEDHNIVVGYRSSRMVCLHLARRTSSSRDLAHAYGRLTLASLLTLAVQSLQARSAVTSSGELNENVVNSVNTGIPSPTGVRWRRRN